jgi:hypothetical protein
MPAARPCIRPKKIGKANLTPVLLLSHRFCGFLAQRGAHLFNRCAMVRFRSAAAGPHATAYSFRSASLNEMARSISPVESRMRISLRAKARVVSRGLASPSAPIGMGGPRGCISTAVLSSRNFVSITRPARSNGSWEIRRSSGINFRHCENMPSPSALILFLRLASM